MATLPEMTSGLTAAVDFVDYPTQTWLIDPSSARIRGMTDGLEAMKQAVEIALNVERYRYQIYSTNFGIEFEGLIGGEFGFVTSEIKRRVNDALLPDIRVTGTSDFQFQNLDNTSLKVSFLVHTVFGELPLELEVI